MRAPIIIDRPEPNPEDVRDHFDSFDLLYEVSLPVVQILDIIRAIGLQGKLIEASILEREIWPALATLPEVRATNIAAIYNQLHAAAESCLDTGRIEAAWTYVGVASEFRSLVSTEKPNNKTFIRWPEWVIAQARNHDSHSFHHNLVFGTMRIEYHDACIGLFEISPALDSFLSEIGRMFHQGSKLAEGTANNLSDYISQWSPCPIEDLCVVCNHLRIGAELCMEQRAFEAGISYLNCSRLTQKLTAL